MTDYITSIGGTRRRVELAARMDGTAVSVSVSDSIDGPLRTAIVPMGDFLLLVESVCGVRIVPGGDEAADPVPAEREVDPLGPLILHPTSTDPEVRAIEMLMIIVQGLPSDRERLRVVEYIRSRLYADGG